MKELVVLSGKGGTGKTSITLALATLAENKVLADCDVDAADLHLVLKPKNISRQDFIGGKKAFIREDLCTGCGRCAELCRFAAISEKAAGTYAVDTMSCEGCGVCSHFCPVQAAQLQDTVDGE